MYCFHIISYLLAPFTFTLHLQIDGASSRSFERNFSLKKMSYLSKVMLKTPLFTRFQPKKSEKNLPKPQQKICTKTEKLKKTNLI